MEEGQSPQTDYGRFRRDPGVSLLSFYHYILRVVQTLSHYAYHHIIVFHDRQKKTASALLELILINGTKIGNSESKTLSLANTRFLLVHPVTYRSQIVRRAEDQSVI